MPIVTIQVTREGTKPGVDSVTAEEKAALIKGASELLLGVLNKPLDSTFVIIEEVEMDNWGFGGLPVAEFRRFAARENRLTYIISASRVLAGDGFAATSKRTPSVRSNTSYYSSSSRRTNARHWLRDGSPP